MAEPSRAEAGWIRSIQRDRTPAAATALVEQYYPEINRYLRRQLPDLADDLTQEVFIAALQHIDRFDPRRASFRTWLYRIATNKLVDQVRSRQRRGQHTDLDGFDVADPTDVAEWVADADLARRGRGAPESAAANSADRAAEGVCPEQLRRDRRSARHPRGDSQDQLLPRAGEST